MSRRKLSAKEWADRHRVEATLFLRESLLVAVKPHVDTLGHDGHLTLEEIRGEILALYVALPEIVEALEEQDK